MGVKVIVLFVLWNPTIVSILAVASCVKNRGNKDGNKIYWMPHISIFKRVLAAVAVIPRIYS